MIKQTRLDPITKEVITVPKAANEKKEAGATLVALRRKRVAKLQNLDSEKPSCIRL
ncbi:MAG: hypothetical protein ACYC2T_06590 [Bacillota bacterium]